MLTVTPICAIWQSIVWCSVNSITYCHRNHFEGKVDFTWGHLLYPVITACKRSLGQGNIFIGVCQEFCSQGGYLGRYPPGPGTHPPRPGTHPRTRCTPPGPGTPPRTRHTPHRTRYTPWTRYTHPRDQVHPPSHSSACWEIQATSRRYASYWNAFLFSLCI